MTPDVNGTLLAEEAPENAAVVVEGLGDAIVLLGLSTLRPVSIL
jgi:hypothetical protein